MEVKKGYKTCLQKSEQYLLYDNKKKRAINKFYIKTRNELEIFCL
jgi:hypothetical protein